MPPSNGLAFMVLEGTIQASKGRKHLIGLNIKLKRNGYIINGLKQFNIVVFRSYVKKIAISIIVSGLKSISYKRSIVITFSETCKLT